MNNVAIGRVVLTNREHIIALEPLDKGLIGTLRRGTFPEIDRAAWFGSADARRKILKGQTVFVDRLLEALGSWR